jgi:hypothetical protein
MEERINVKNEIAVNIILVNGDTFKVIAERTLAFERRLILPRRKTLRNQILHYYCEGQVDRRIYQSSLHLSYVLDQKKNALCD